MKIEIQIQIPPEEVPGLCADWDVTPGELPAAFLCPIQDSLDDARVKATVTACCPDTMLERLKKAVADSSPDMIPASADEKPPYAWSALKHLVETLVSRVTGKMPITPVMIDALYKQVEEIKRETDQIPPQWRTKKTAQQLLDDPETQNAGKVCNGDWLLEDTACPECGCRGPFRIQGKVTLRVNCEGSSADGDHGWDADSRILCTHCDRAGSVEDFTFPGLDLLVQERLKQDPEYVKRQRTD